MQPLLQLARFEFVRTQGGRCQSLEPHQPIDGRAVLEHDERRQRLELELGSKERCLLSIESQELARCVLLNDLAQMHVHDLATFKVFVEEMHGHEFGGAGAFRQELILRDGAVVLVAFGNVLHAFDLLLFELLQAALAECLHGAIIVQVIIEVAVIEAVVVVFFTFGLFAVAAVVVGCVGGLHVQWSLLVLLLLLLRHHGGWRCTTRVLVLVRIDQLANIPQSTICALGDDLFDHLRFITRLCREWSQRIQSSELAAFGPRS
mmetsp:Transcript_10669/g.29429  ORF Transcript_10669/g.29429 Transcript_10669/m.29429 type:complete len:262 (+) Transcript_10669:367-1152(+)